jgi:tripartite-type tricarboxylate transporter receptor subunit TctC
LFKVMTGVDLVIVNYHGSGPALPDLIGGHVQAMFDVVSSSIGHIRAGRLRPLAVTTPTPLDVLPDIPPIGDFVPKYEASSWDGIGAPANTPPEVIAISAKKWVQLYTTPRSKPVWPIWASSPFRFRLPN